MIAQNMTEASPILNKGTQTLPLIGHERLLGLDHRQVQSLQRILLVICTFTSPAERWKVNLRLPCLLMNENTHEPQGPLLGRRVQENQRPATQMKATRGDKKLTR